MTIGSWIRFHRTLPRMDTWTELGSGRPWRADAWLFDVIVSYAESFGGERLLLFLKLTVFFGVAVALHRTYTPRAAYPFGMLITILVAGGVLVDAELSPHLVGLLFLPGIASAAVGAGQGNKRGIITAVVLGALLINLSGSPLLLALALFAGAIHTVSCRLGVLLLIFAAACSLNPYGPAILVDAVTAVIARADTALRYRSEVATIFDFRTAFLILVWLLVVLLPRDRTETRLRTAVMAAGLATIAAAASGAAQLYALVLSGLALAYASGCSLPREQNPLREGLERSAELIGRLSPAGLTWLLLCFAVVNVVPAVKRPVNHALLPGPAVDFILDRRLPHPVFHERRVGYYLVYRFQAPDGSPRMRALADDRLELFDLEAVRGDEAVERLTIGWEEHFERVRPRTVLCRIASPLHSALLRDPRWKMRFEALHEVGEPPPENEEKIRAYLWSVFERVEEG